MGNTTKQHKKQASSPVASAQPIRPPYRTLAVFVGLLALVLLAPQRFLQNLGATPKPPNPNSPLERSFLGDRLGQPNETPTCAFLVPFFETNCRECQTSAKQLNHIRDLMAALLEKAWCAVIRPTIRFDKEISPYLRNLFLPKKNETGGVDFFFSEPGPWSGSTQTADKEALDALLAFLNGLPVEPFKPPENMAQLVVIPQLWLTVVSANSDIPTDHLPTVWQVVRRNFLERERVVLLEPNLSPELRCYDLDVYLGVMENLDHQPVVLLYPSCLAKTSRGIALGRFDFVKFLTKEGVQVIQVSDEDYRALVCNGVSAGPGKWAIPSRITSQLQEELRRAGIDVVKPPVGVHLGDTPNDGLHCSVLPLPVGRHFRDLLGPPHKNPTKNPNSGHRTHPFGRDRGL